MQATQTAQLLDQELIDLYLNGNEKAFEVLLRRHKARIYTAIYIFCKDSQLSEDVDSRKNTCFVATKDRKSTRLNSSHG